MRRRRKGSSAASGRAEHAGEPMRAQGIHLLPRRRHHRQQRYAASERQIIARLPASLSAGRPAGGRADRSAAGWTVFLMPSASTHTHTSSSAAAASARHNKNDHRAVRLPERDKRSKEARSRLYLCSGPDGQERAWRWQIVFERAAPAPALCCVCERVESCLGRRTSKTKQVAPAD